jgi:DNA ligase (NAD+)
MSKRIQELRDILHHHNTLYHVVGKPVITDAKFDELLKELQELETKYPESADVNSPTQRIGGAPIQGFQQFKHVVKMLSLDKVFSADEFLTWWKGEPVAIEPKIDGLACSLHYVNGYLDKAVTRGDGSVGDDVTANVRTIRSVPLVIRDQGLPLQHLGYTGEIRGEVYLSKARFEALNKELEAAGEEQLANPRNAAAGTLKSLDPKEVHRRGLSFVAYSIVDSTRRNYEQEQKSLKAAGFDTAAQQAERIGLDPYLLTTATKDMMPILVEPVLKTWQTALAKLPMETDGAVLKYTAADIRQELGAGNKTLKWAVAYKFPPKKETTVLQDIELSVGRTGIVVPNARLKPVVIAGTTVSNASLCNQDEVERLGICIGDTVLVEKSGEIIPKVVGIYKTYDDSPVPDYGSPEAAERAWKFPRFYVDARSGKQAPRKIYRKPGEVAYRIEHPEACFDCVHAQLTHATSKLALDWDGCGPAQIDVLMTSGASKVADLFRVSAEETGLTGKTLENFLGSREEVKRRPLWRFLRALCSDGVGSTYCKQIAALARNWRAALELPLWRLEELMGPVKAKAFESAKPGLKQEFQALEQAGCVLDDDKTSGGGKQPLKGLVFCITGALSKGRDEVQNLIEAAGGLAKSGVTKATNFLVAGDEPGGSKLKAAAKHGTKIINENELYEMINEG